MANTISARSSIFVQFNIDTNAAGPVSVRLLCNRDYAVVDYNVLAATQAAGGGNATISATDLAAATTTIGLVTGQATGSYTRPSQSTNNAANGYLSGTAAVVRGGTLTVTAPDTGDLIAGYIAVLPGNRYSAVTSQTAYYANNTASGNNNGTVSI